MLFKVIFIAIVTATVTGQFCPASYEFDYSSQSCAFYYQFYDQNCTQFKFIECTWVECVDWVTVGNDTYCDQTQIFSDYLWNRCTDQCCDDSVTYPYGLDGIQQCQDYLTRQNTIAIIIISCIGGAIGLIVLIFVIVSCCRNGSCRWQCADCRDCRRAFLHLFIRQCCFKQNQTKEGVFQKLVQEDNFVSNIQSSTPNSSPGINPK